MKWDDDTTTVALYLLTCPHRTTEGLFRLPKPYAMADLDWDASRFNAAFSRLEQEGFLAYDDDAALLLLVNSLKYQRPDNANQQKGAEKALEDLPDSPLWDTFLRSAEEHCQSFADFMRKRMPQRFGKAFGEALAEASAEGLIQDIPNSPPPPPTLKDTYPSGTALPPVPPSALGDTSHLEQPSPSEAGAVWAGWEPSPAREFCRVLGLDTREEADGARVWMQLRQIERIYGPGAVSEAVLSVELNAPPGGWPSPAEAMKYLRGCCRREKERADQLRTAQEARASPVHALSLAERIALGEGG